jgi:hypothetical protein
MELAASTMTRSHPGFARYHRGDRNFFLIYVALIWLVILAGFAPQVLKHIKSGAPAYPLIVHVHAVIFVGWLVLLTTQVLLIRSSRPDLHRTLGLAGVALSVLMIVIGPATAVVVDRLRLALPSPDPGFVAVQTTDILAFAGLVIPAFLWRKSPSLHKRLILLATLYIADAGFDRWWGPTLEVWFGDGFWGNAAQFYLGSDLLIVGIGVYDWITRRRLHAGYIGGVAWIVLVQTIALSLYMDPRFAPVARELLKS